MNGHRSAPHCYGSLELLELISNQSCASKGKHSMMKTKTKMSVLPSPSHNPRPRQFEHVHIRGATSLGLAGLDRFFQAFGGLKLEILIQA